MSAVIDTFTDTNGTLLENHVSDSGHIWTRLDYECRIIDSKLVASSHVSLDYLYVVNPTFTDCFVQARFVYTAGGAWELVLRYTNTFAVYVVSVQPLAGDRIKIGRGIGVNFVQLGIVARYVGVNEVVRFEAVGNVLTCYVSNVAVLSVTDSLYTVGQVGLAGDSYYTPKYDDFFSDGIPSDRTVVKKGGLLRKSPSPIDWQAIQSRLYS